MAEFTNAKHVLRNAGITPSSVGTMHRYYQFSSLANAQASAQYSADAYMSWADIQKKYAGPTRTLFQIEDKSSNTFGFGLVDTSTRQVVISFRGTQLTSIRNILHDMEFIRTPIKPGSPYSVCAGFLSAYHAVQSQVRNVIAQAVAAAPQGLGGAGNIALLTVTGHSLGGALANLAALDLAEYLNEQYKTLLGNNYIVYTFAAPPFTNWELSLQFVRMATTLNYFRSFQIINPFDIVPYGLSATTPVLGFFGCGLDMILGDWFCVKHGAVTPLCHGISTYQSLLAAIPSNATWSDNYQKDMRLGNRWTVVGITAVDFNLPSASIHPSEPPSAIAFNNSGLVLGVYTSNGSLYARVGAVNQDGTLNWYATAASTTGTVTNLAPVPQQIDYGSSPALKMNNHGTLFMMYYDDGSVSKRKPGLYWSIGTVTAADGVSWQNNLNNWMGTLINPSVSINDEGDVIAVCADSQNNLYWFVGKIQNGDIQWAKGSNNIFVSKAGATPSVALNNYGFVIETHVQPNTTKLMYQLGQIDQHGNFQWSGSPQQFDSGTAPSVALDNKGSVAVVHQGATNSGTLYYNTAYYSGPKAIKFDNANDGVNITPGQFPRANFNDEGFLLIGYRSGANDMYILGKSVFNDFQLVDVTT